MEVNINDLLMDLSQQILKVYNNSINKNSDANAKQPLDVLTEIEITLENHIKELKYIEKNEEWEIEVNKEEKNLKAEYKKKQREINQNREKDANEKKNNDLKERMDRVYQKMGRVAMPRSMKKKVKREKAEIKVDQDTLDQNRYLGEMQI